MLSDKQKESYHLVIVLPVLSALLKDSFPFSKQDTTTWNAQNKQQLIAAVCKAFIKKFLFYTQ